MNDRLEDAKLRVSESIHIAENALVEKDAALLREKHALNEVARLESTISMLNEEAGERTQSEILKVKDNYNSNIRQVSQEVVRLEMEANRKQLEFTKMLKEKDKMTSRLENIQGELESKKQQHHEEILNLHQRISSQESRIVALLAEKDNLTSINSHTFKEHEEQREELLQRIQELEQQVAASRGSCESLRIQYENLKREYQSSLNEFRNVEEERKLSEKSLKRQLRLSNEELEEVTASNSIRLDAVDSNHKSVVKQLTENISVLQESYSK